MYIRATAASLLAWSVLALAEPSAAQTAPFQAVESAKRWRVEIGGGVVHGFSATGDADKDANFIPWGSASYKDIVYANGLDGLGWNIISSDRLRAGVQLRPRFSAGDIEGYDLDRPGLGADATVYAFRRLPGNIVAGGRVQYDATNDDAGLEYYASVAQQSVTRVGLLNTTVYVRGGDGDRNERYYGVPASAAASGLTPYEAGGGLAGAGAAVFLAVPVGERFGVGAFVNYERALGDVADSPLMDKADTWRAGLIGVARFGSRD